MPRFYFHVINGRLLNDDVGIELADVAAAKVEALNYAGAVLKDERPVDIWNGRSWQMRVSDSPSLVGGHTILLLSLSGTDLSSDH